MDTQDVFVHHILPFLSIDDRLCLRILPRLLPSSTRPALSSILKKYRLYEIPSIIEHYWTWTHESLRINVSLNRRLSLTDKSYTYTTCVVTKNDQSMPCRFWRIETPTSIGDWWG